MTMHTTNDSISTPVAGLDAVQPAIVVGPSSHRRSIHARVKPVPSATDESQESNANDRPEYPLNRPIGLSVPSLIALTNGRASLDVALDLEAYDGVKIQGLPPTVRLNRGQSITESTVLVSGLELVGLELIDREPQGQDFVLNITPTRQWNVFWEAARTINVVYEAIPPSVRIPNFGIVTGHSGPFPIENLPDDLSISIAIGGLPPNVALSTGRQIGDEWLLRDDEVRGLRIHAVDAVDTTNWQTYFNYLYRAFPVTYAVETSSARESTAQVRSFLMYVFQG